MPYFQLATFPCVVFTAVPFSINHFRFNSCSSESQNEEGKVDCCVLLHTCNFIFCQDFCENAYSSVPHEKPDDDDSFISKMLNWDDNFISLAAPLSKGSTFPLEEWDQGRK